jgi:hypothetical protein
MPGNNEQPLKDNAKSGNNQRPHLNHSTKQRIETFQSNQKASKNRGNNNHRNNDTLSRQNRKSDHVFNQKLQNCSAL